MAQNIVVTGGPTAIASTGLSMIIAPTGTVAANGAITLGTALLYTPGSCYLYLPAGAAFAGSVAGWYFTVMSSSTVGIVYNNLAQTLGIPTPPVVVVPIVAAGPGAYTGVTTAQTAFTVQVPPIGPFGQLRYTHSWTWNNSAGTKTARFNYGGTNIFSTAGSTTNGAQSANTHAARGNQTLNAAAPDTLGMLTGTYTTYTTAGGIGTTTLVDPTLPQLFFCSLQLNTATDFMSLENFLLEVVTGTLAQTI